MSRECRIMPELHEEIVNLINLVQTIHAHGEGRISIALLSSVFGAHLSDVLLEQLLERGDLVLRKTSESGGNVTNEGQRIEFTVPPAHFTVPEAVRGSYFVQPGGAGLSFDSDHTIVGKVLFFSAKLEDIRCDMHRMDIDVSGDSFDQCIIHSPS